MEVWQVDALEYQTFIWSEAHSSTLPWGLRGVSYVNWIFDPEAFSGVPRPTRATYTLVKRQLLYHKRRISNKHMTRREYKRPLEHQQKLLSRP